MQRLPVKANATPVGDAEAGADRESEAHAHLKCGSHGHEEREDPVEKSTAGGGRG
jgi:hypothetical protein